jgi:peptidoglycan/xylan/chitin deacetylase (PgdA/CDA1 family)
MLPELSSAEVVRQLLSTKRAIQDDTHSPVELVRPPYGASDRRVERSVRSLGLVDVLWSIDSRDSEGADWSQIAARVERFVRPGSIILMHENRGQTIRALRRAILPFLHARGFLPVSVPELLARDPPTHTQLAAGVNGCYPRGAPRPTSAGGG